MIEKMPIMIYDGDCGFCKRWIEKWRLITGDKVAYESYKKVSAQYPQVTALQCKEAVQLVLSDGHVFSGAKAVFFVLQIGGKHSFLFWSYEHIPLFQPLSEWCYRLVAHNRIFFSKWLSAPECKL